jgi:hypothetical protein
MAGRKKGIDKTEEKLIHVFDDIYLGYDEYNITIMKKKVSKKTEKVSFVNEGYFIGAKALFSNLYERYALARIKDETIIKPEILIGIENFVNKVEGIKADFDKVSVWK